MAIQISGTTVIDNSRNLTNIGSASANSLGGNWISTQAEAEAGTNNDQVMTPLRVSQAISALAGGGMVDSDINWSTCNVGCSVRGGGNVIRKTGGTIWIVAPSSTQRSSPWPMGYCTNDQGGQPKDAYGTTGRSGWFIPDLSMLRTAYFCRTYWDTYTTKFYWSSTECSITTASTVNFACSANCCCALKCACNNATGGNYIRPMRVICY